MRLIDADALKDCFEGIYWYHINKRGDLVGGALLEDGALYMAKDIYKALDYAPTIDAVEVVRCRDCRYFNGENKFCDYSIQVKDDDYCSYGERCK